MTDILFVMPFAAAIPMEDIAAIIAAIRLFSAYWIMANAAVAAIFKVVVKYNSSIFFFKHINLYTISYFSSNSAFRSASHVWASARA